MNGARCVVASLLLVAGGTAAAEAPDCTSLAAADWLLGDWAAPSPGGEVVESWAAVSESTWEGRGMSRKAGSDALRTFETLRLVEMSSRVFYVAKVEENELPVAFRLVDCSAGRLVFENPAHDFPQRIAYRLDGEGRLEVTVSDLAGKGFTLNFSRLPPRN